VKVPLHILRRSRLSIGPGVLLLAIGIAPGAHGTPPDERQQFLAAEQALAEGDTEGFEQLAEGLHQYPLYPYLRFEAITRDISQAGDSEVQQFLAAYADTPLAPRLRRLWLAQLAKEERWPEYVRTYRPDGSVERRCHYLRGLIALGRREEAFAQVEPLWLSGRSRPAACNPVFQAWKGAGHLSPALVWARIDRAMAARNLGLARGLRKLLAPDDQTWLDRWLAVDRAPAKVLDQDAFAAPHPQRERILVHGVKRLARTDAPQAAEAWDSLQQIYRFTPDLAAEATAAVGFALADADDQRALGYLDRVPANAENAKLQERRLRAAIKLGDWKRLVTWIDRLPPKLRESDHWLYWKGRALDTLGTGAQARALFEQAAGQRGLWGFLAAERLDEPYNLDDIPAPADPARIAAIRESAAAKRIGELSALGRKLDVRREWYHLTRGMDPKDLEAAAVVAGAWGWPDQAIFALARSGYWDDLELRFPLAYGDLVCAESRATGLNASWIYALVRQESAFAPTVVSPAGAVGLMQLMPATAASVAAADGESVPSPLKLSDPAVNLALGSRFLARMSQRFEGNEVLATAAYNAGPHQVSRWLPEHPIAADIWIATIPFRETREYVQRVLAYRVIYDARLGRTIVPLRDLMEPIGPSSLLTGTRGGSRAGAGG
jgi:soluble lytic murein transglycosylase